MSKESFISERQSLKNELDRVERHPSLNAVDALLTRYQGFLQNHSEFIEAGFFQEIDGLRAGLESARKYKAQSAVDKHIRSVVWGLNCDITALMRIDPDTKKPGQS